jgi:hypothetical protein
MNEMRDIAAQVKPLADAALRRAKAALAQLKPPALFEVAAAETRFAGLIGATV